MVLEEQMELDCSLVTCDGDEGMVDMGLDFVVVEDKLEVWPPPVTIGLTSNSLRDGLCTRRAIIVPTDDCCIVLLRVSIIQSIVNSKAAYTCCRGKRYQSVDH